MMEIIQKGRSVSVGISVRDAKGGEGERSEPEDGTAPPTTGDFFNLNTCKIKGDCRSERVARSSPTRSAIAVVGGGSEGKARHEGHAHILMISLFAQRMRSFLLAVFLGITAFLDACKPSKATPPLPEQTFAHILKDMHFIHNFVQDNKSIPIEEKNLALKKYYLSILSKHKVSTKQFYDAMDYYSKNVAKMDSVYGLALEFSSTPTLK